MLHNRDRPTVCLEQEKIPSCGPLAVDMETTKNLSSPKCDFSYGISSALDWSSHGLARQGGQSWHVLVYIKNNKHDVVLVGHRRVVLRVYY